MLNQMYVQQESVNLLKDMNATVLQKGDTIFSTWIGDKGEEAQFSFNHIWDRSGAIAHTLIHKYKLRKGDRIILCYGFGLEFFVAFLACLRSGVIAVPVYPPNPTKLKMSLEKLELIVNSAGATICLTDNAINWYRKAQSMNVLSGAKWPKNLKWESTEAISAGSGKAYDEPSLRPDEVAFLQYTSGSTGDPKGVMITFGNLDHNVNDLMLMSLNRDIFRNRSRVAEDITNVVGTSWLPQYHDMGLIVGLIMPFRAGFRMYHMSPMTFVKNPLVWVKTMSKYGVHFSTAPNFALGLTARRWKSSKGKQEPLDLSALQFIQLGGEPVNPEHIEAFTTTFTPMGLRRDWVGPAYGLAEHTVAVSYCTEIVCCKVYQPPLVACGTDFRVDVRIVDADTLMECQDGKQGEIWLSSKSCAQGYWGREDATEETFRARMASPDRPPVHGNGIYMRTGDMGFLEDGYLYICGRIKDLIILRGKNYYPQDIEGVVEKASQNVRPGCLAAFGSQIEGFEDEQVEIVFEWREMKGGPSSKAFVKQELETIYKTVVSDAGIRPYRIVAIMDRTIPKTTSGKIRRRATRDALHAGELKVIDEVLFGAKGGEGAVVESSTGQETLQLIEAVVSPRLAGNSQQGGVTDMSSAETPEQLREHLLQSLQDKLQAVVLETALEVTGLDSVDVDTPLMDLGLESIVAIEFREKLSDQLGGLDLPDTVVFDHPTIRQIAAFLLTEILGAQGARDSSNQDPSRGPAVPNEPLAVIGMSCRFPGSVDGAQSFWEILVNGVDTITEIPKDRWDIDEYYDPDPEVPGRMYTRYGAFVDHIELFDAKFFGISAPEALAMDPQQRLLLEVCYCAFYNSGYTRQTLLGKDAGVFVGVCSSDFSRIQQARVGPYSATGASQSIISNRVSFALGLKGPSMSLDTACSSSLVAMHLASKLLQAGNCSVAAAAGVNLILIPDTYIAVCQGRMLAPDGRCKTFDASANGYVRGEGCGAVVLKRLSEARADHNKIFAVVKGTAVNQDGRSATLTAPNGPSQQEVIRSALREGSLNALDVDYVETHGTGTGLGDPIEIGALKSVLGAGRLPDRPLVLGSVKTNIGHLEGAAGVAGLIKAILVLYHREAPPNLHFKTLNPSINIDKFPVTIPVERTPIGVGKEPDQPLVAGVSSFGFGGTNSHIILQSVDPSDALNAEIDQAEVEKGLLAFLFTGQGSQYANMGRGLYETQPVFRKIIDRCDAILQPLWPVSLVSLLYPSDGVENPLIHETAYSQPALFAVEMALAELWKSVGVVPDAVMGHSAGEYVAACVAGVFTLEEGIKIVAERGRIMQALPKENGCMFAVRATEGDVLAAISQMKAETARGNLVSIAAINGPKSTVLSGPRDVVEAIITKLKAGASQLQVSHAFHSPLMTPAADAIRELFSKVTLKSPSLPVICNVTGSLADDGDLTSS